MHYTGAQMFCILIMLNLVLRLFIPTNDLGTRERPGYEGTTWVRGNGLGTREQPGYEGAAWVRGNGPGTRERPGYEGTARVGG